LSSADIAGQESETTDGYLAEPFDYVFTVCGDAKEACRVCPSAKNCLYWLLRYPSQATGTEEERL
jgi:arsenate reductase